MTHVDEDPDLTVHVREAPTVRARARDDGDDDGGGVEVEKWILRVLLASAVVTLVTAVVGSLDDLKRYIRMRQM